MWGFGPPLIRGLGRIMWRLEIQADHGSPDPPFVVAANHHSFLDAFLIASALRHKIRFLALSDLFGHYRLVDRALDAFDVIPLRRGAVPLGPVRAALAHLSKGGAVGLFPEGTRHWEFDPARARPGAAWLAAKTGVPLIPVVIEGTERVLGVDNRLHRGRIRITIGPPLHASGNDRSAVQDLSTSWSRWVSDVLT